MVGILPETAGGAKGERLCSLLGERSAGDALNFTDFADFDDSVNFSGNRTWRNLLVGNNLRYFFIARNFSLKPGPIDAPAPIPENLPQIREIGVNLFSESVVLRLDAAIAPST